jgi:D-alanine transaminase
MTVRRARPPSPNTVAKGVAVLTMPDPRWARCDIKSVGLLPNVLCKQAAKASGAFEAWLVDRDGFVTEGSSTNAWIVIDGTIMTRQADAAILNGVTRLAVLEAARGAGLTIAQRAFTVAEAQSAAEAFLTSTTSTVLPVVAIDDRPVGDGKPGPVSLMLRRALDAAIDRQVVAHGPVT